MLPRKSFESLHAPNGHFSAFRIIFRQILFKILTLILSASPDYYPKRGRSLLRIDRFLVIGR